MDDFSDEGSANQRRIKISKELLNPIRYGRCRTRDRMGDQGWVVIEVLLRRLVRLGV